MLTRHDVLVAYRCKFHGEMTWFSVEGEHKLLVNEAIWSAPNDISAADLARRLNEGRAR